MRSIKRFVLFVWLVALGALSGMQASESSQYGTTDSEPWYYIRFCRGGAVLTAQGVGNSFVARTPKGAKSQLWKKEGSNSKFQLVNQEGIYVTVEGKYSSAATGNSLRVVGAKSKDKKGFAIHSSKDQTYTGKDEIQHKGYYGKTLCLNQTGGYGDGTPIGLYDADDINNPVEWVLVDSDSGTDVDVRVEGAKNFAPTDKYTLWYTEPASNWMEYSLPIGNGQLGASLFGGVSRDEIQFNEKTLWSGTSTSVGSDRNGNDYGYYLNFGSIFITNRDPELTVAKNYHRELNLTKATGAVEFTNADGSVQYKKEYIASYPDKVVAAHLTATQNQKISINVSLAPGMNSIPRVTYQNGEAYFGGNLEVVSYQAHLKVVPKGGKMTTSMNGIQVMGADEVLIVLGAGTNFKEGVPSLIDSSVNLASSMKDRVDKAAQKGWQNLYKAHTDDFSTYFDRVHLDLTGSENTKPTDALVKSYNSGGTMGNAPLADQLMLEELYFTYGRYLSIASSRGVALPSNLQGIWNNNNEAAWHSDIHANINVQMNYWPVESTNLSDMHKPFLDYIINMSKSDAWKRWAQEADRSSRGWTCFTENNIFGGVGKWAHNYVIVNAWYCTHLWQHYRYTLDRAFLEKAFPAMLGAVQFWLDRLKPDTDGFYVCPNEYSPEHGPEQEDGVAHAQQLVYDLFSNTLEAIKVLGEDKCGISRQDYADLQEKFGKLDNGLRIETYDGAWGYNVNGVTNGTPILKEWKKSPYSRGNNGHRHMSHLMCLYPFSQVTPGSDLFNAAVNSLQLRGDQSTGWSMGWKINLWARALEGNHAHKILKMALRHSTSYAMDESQGGIYYNLYDSHAPFQIDGNFGACAGITEMLFQSDRGILYGLPALPDAWKNGSITGLKGVGNFTVDLTWNNLKATKMTIVNLGGQDCRVKCLKGERPIDQCLVTVDGKEVAVKAEADQVFLIPSAEGQTIEIDFTQDKGSGTTPDVPVYSGTCGANLTWNLNAKTGVLTLDGKGATYDFSDANLPTWTPVALEVKSIVLPKALTRIGDHALEACVNLANLTVESNIEFGVNAVSEKTHTKLVLTDADYADANFVLNNSGYDEITYNRTLTSSKWGSIVVPFRLSEQSKQDFYFYELSTIEGDALVFARVKNPVANAPYIFKNAPSRQASSLSSDGYTEIDPAGALVVPRSDWKMYGTYEHKTFAGSDLATTYVLAGGKIMHSNAELSVAPFRAYFTGPVFSKQMRILIQDENGTTDITDELMDPAEEDDTVYDLTGRRVLEPVSGNIYIQHGKKFIAQ